MLTASVIFYHNPNMNFEISNPLIKQSHTSICQSKGHGAYLCIGDFHLKDWLAGSFPFNILLLFLSSQQDHHINNPVQVEAFHVPLNSESPKHQRLKYIFISRAKCRLLTI